MKNLILDFFNSISDEKRAEIIKDVEYHNYSGITKTRLLNLISPNPPKNTDDHFRETVIHYLWRKGYVEILPEGIDRLTYFEHSILADIPMLSDEDNIAFYLEIEKRGINKETVKKFIETSGIVLLKLDEIQSVCNCLWSVSREIKTLPTLCLPKPKPRPNPDKQINKNVSINPDSITSLPKSKEQFILDYFKKCENRNDIFSGISKHGVCLCSLYNFIQFNGEIHLSESTYEIIIDYLCLHEKLDIDYLSFSLYSEFNEWIATQNSMYRSDTPLLAVYKQFLKWRNKQVR